ncbi:hypothetical protein U1Q18_027470 [Sarracenia purpurea var. burkii]
MHRRWSSMREDRGTGYWTERRRMATVSMAPRDDGDRRLAAPWFSCEDALKMLLHIFSLGVIVFPLLVLASVAWPGGVLCLSLFGCSNLVVLESGGLCRCGLLLKLVFVDGLPHALA